MTGATLKPWEPGEGPQRYIRELEAEVERLKAENAEQKAEMQKLYDNWVRVLKLPEEPKP